MTRSREEKKGNSRAQEPKCGFEMRVSYRIHGSWTFRTGSKLEPVLDTHPYSSPDVPGFGKLLSSGRAQGMDEPALTVLLEAKEEF